MLTVEKIGGTSMSQFQDVLANIIKGKRSGRCCGTTGKGYGG